MKCNILSASAEHRKQNAMVVLHMRNKQEQKEMRYLQERNAKNKMRRKICRCEISKSKRK